MTEAGYARILLDKKDTQIMGLESEITKLRIEYEKQIKKLQKENAELKERYDKVDIIGYDALKNLTKAKKLLKQFLDAKNGEDTYKAEWDAEQFLKEIEK